ncbi:hypothetical protein [Erythrobacter sp. MTPC3]|uniref:hypothetical protein n=1 Tax=Erythrobacter sp. MTPC3 TaxID=3056564 RepID=UPI0036F3CD35
MRISTFAFITGKTLAMLLAAGLAAGAANAQSADDADKDETLDGLKACQLIADDAERLACFDLAVGTIVTAADTGDIRVVDREEARETRRSLFGFNLPDLGIFGGGDDEEEKDELFETTITSARYLSSKTVRFTTAEGAVWEMKNLPRRLRTIKSGDTAIFKEASLGTYFVRINGQLGVRGRRIQ